ncbi:MAG: hypothetical protein QOG98_914 [Pseudonocardiales bacterium]|nr:hypothetical protein [Pseudonocardiales bacterium]
MACIDWGGERCLAGLGRPEILAGLPVTMVASWDPAMQA